MKSRVAPRPIGTVAHGRLAVDPFQPGGGGAGDLGIEHDVEVRVGQPAQVGRRGAERGGDVHLDAQPAQQAPDLDDVVAVAEAERRGAEQVAARAVRRGARRGRGGEVAHQLVEGLRRAPELLLLIGGQLQREDRDRQVEGLGEAAGIVLDQLGGAGGADDHRLGLEALVGVARGGLEQFGGVAAEVAGLEGGVGHRRAVVAPLDHGEQQVGVGVALRGVQNVVNPLHRRRHPHGADVGRSLIGPDAELHRLHSKHAPCG